MQGLSLHRIKFNPFYLKIKEGIYDFFTGVVE